jgi:predicted nucleic acid-binding protein
MSKKYLLDTNILTYYFNGDLAVKPIFDEIKTSVAQGFYCPISWIELLCYSALTEDEANLMREFLRQLNCVSLTECILDCATKIRRDRVKLADALIAACALVQGYTLVTRNVDFSALMG